MALELFGTPLKPLCAMWIDSKAADRKAIAAHVRAGAERKDDSRWRNAATDMEAGDELRVKARSLTGEEAKAAWSKAKEVNPKTASAKPKGVKATKAKATAKAEPTAPAGKQTVASLSKRMDGFENRMDAVETRLDRIGDSLEVMMGLMQGKAA